MTPNPAPTEAYETLSAHVVANDVGTISRRSQLRNQEILKLWTGIAPAQQEPLIPEVDPIDRFLRGERVAFRTATMIRSLLSDIVLVSGRGDVAPGTIAISTTALRSAVTRRARELSSNSISICGKRCPTSNSDARRFPADNRRVEADRQPSRLAAAIAARIHH